MAEGKTGAGAAPWRPRLNEILFAAGTRSYGRLGQGHDADAVHCKFCGTAL